MTNEVFAGYLCATHVGEWLRFDGVQGVCHRIQHSEEHSTVFVVLHDLTDRREDGSRRKVAHLLKLDPRDIVTVVPPAS